MNAKMSFLSVCLIAAISSSCFAFINRTLGTPISNIASGNTEGYTLSVTDAHFNCTAEMSPKSGPDRAVISIQTQRLAYRGGEPGSGELTTEYNKTLIKDTDYSKFKWRGNTSDYKVTQGFIIQVVNRGPGLVNVLCE